MTMLPGAGEGIATMCLERGTYEAVGLSPTVSFDKGHQGQCSDFGFAFCYQPDLVLFPFLYLQGRKT